LEFSGKFSYLEMLKVGTRKRSNTRNLKTRISEIDVKRLELTGCKDLGVLRFTNKKCWMIEVGG
jgi:hypothetical protein